MDSVLINNHVKHYYTWEECVFLWDDIRVNKKFEEFGVVAGDISVKEMLDVYERRRSEFLKKHKELIGVVGMFPQPARIVMGNVAINEGELDIDSFIAATNTPPGYEMFVDYNVGDYEYKDALVRIILESSEVGTEPIIYDAVVNVDIEDTDDRGTNQIIDTTAPTKIYFHKFYYHPPEISVTIKGGNIADGVITPNIVSVDKSDTKGRYFEVELLNVSGSRVGGFVSWTSKGY